MRKRLGGFVRNDKAVATLKWAADHDCGHRGLLEIGGERALADAVEYAAGERLRYGDRLDELIGETNAVEFICTAMRCASAGLRAGRSRRMILDEIKAQLGRYFENSGLAIFDIAGRHAACGYDLAAAMREALEHIWGRGEDGLIKEFAARAVAWEARADQLLNDARDDVKRFQRPQSLVDFLEYADDAVDELEEGASLLELFALIRPQGLPMIELRQLADMALASSQELVKAIECAATITRADVRDDLDDFLQALERLVALEHQADEQVRLLRRRIICDVRDPCALHLLHQLSQALETATDAYAHAGQSLRRYLTRTSHAAVVARQLGKVCIVGCNALNIDGGQRSGAFDAVAIKEGELVTVDGTLGLIFRGELQVRRSKPERLVAAVRRWQAAGTRAKASKRSSADEGRA